jgi:hypothetical protein
MTAAGGDGGPVDRYLDEMFDLLAGTGASGRRLLAEAEQHLLDAAAEGRARGLDDEAAEHEAVERFGPAAAVARRVPASFGAVRVPLRRLAIWAWALTGTAMTWYGVSGAVTWLLSGPWTRVLIATDRFGRRRMCGPEWIPPGDCLQYYRQDVSYLPGSDNDFPFLVVGGLGVVLLVALLIARRTTPLGEPSWTPSGRVAHLLFALPFGVVGTDLIVEGVDGIFKDVQYYVLTCFVSGLLALVITAAAGWRARRSRSRPAPPTDGPDLRPRQLIPGPTGRPR